MEADTDEQQPGELAVAIHALRVRRGGRLILPGIDLAIRARCVTGLLGPSGSGKSTLLRAIVGVQIVEDGQISVLGQEAGSPDLRKQVAYVTQSASVYPDLTVTENLRYFADVLGVDETRVSATVERVGLDRQRDQLVRTLSGGERSRASLAVALLSEPDLLVLDEPTVGLDPVLRIGLWETFHELAARGASLLVSTHVMDEADRCDELILMREGQIVVTGTPAAIREQSGAGDIEGAFLELAGSSS